MDDIELILTLPACSVASLREDPSPVRGAFATSDPIGHQLGSGGGTVHALLEAWRNAGSPEWDRWIDSSRKLMIHGSGQSRRLPGYAVEGKSLLPLPIFQNATAQRHDQTLLDMQKGMYERIFRNTHESYLLAIACGDVLVANESPLPVCPEADVLIVGIPSSPEEASHHGVLFCPFEDTTHLDFFLQKPSPDRIRELSSTNAIFLDTGIWMFSRRAIDTMIRCSGLDPHGPNGAAAPFDLFDRFATALGEHPAQADALLSGLTAAVLPLTTGHFHHFGTNRSVMASVAQLAAPAESRHSFGDESQLDCPVIRDSLVSTTIPRKTPNVWIDASIIPASWTINGDNVLTGIPENSFTIDLPRGACIDAVSVKDEPTARCWRIYGYDDQFRGKCGDDSTLWQGRPFPEWLALRGIDFAAAGINPESDIHTAPLHPLFDANNPKCGALLSWIVAEKPDANSELAKLWISLPRLSSADLLTCGDPAPRHAARRALSAKAFATIDCAQWAERCIHTDLALTAKMVADGSLSLPPAVEDKSSLAAVHDAMFRARVSGTDDKDATTLLGKLIVDHLSLKPANPRRDILEDQIVWGRSPARIDLAGGWTDTPPYCLEHGGHVVNMALDMNGQPPIQAFARVIKEPKVVLRSIDIGVSTEIETLDQLVATPRLGDAFGIPRMALRLAGFDPRFNGKEGIRDLRSFLESTFGGGVELTTLAAIPKGSGLGTSSIIAANVLGTLSNLCGLNWSQQDIFARTLSLEQLLTAGGGWQDQVGGVIGGVKSIRSEAGIAQRLTIRWLPPRLLQDAIADHRLSLYYTGITRVAHDILGEIVKGIFLNDPRCIDCIGEIALNAEFITDALQRQDWDGVCEAVRRSWTLNRRIDSGTNPQAVQSILDRVAPWTAAAKLAGAGGGGYLLILAKDSASGIRIREELNANPPNDRARFIEPSISEAGFQVTRS